jgi:hypothetical protein
MRRALFLAVAPALLAACDASTVTVDIDPSKTRYSRDARTGQCFAALGRGAPGFSVRAESFSVAAVPCTDAVLALVPRAQGGKA